MPAYEFDLYEVAEEAAAITGVGPDKVAGVHIVPHETICCIYTGHTPPSIRLHPIVNGPWVPREVILHILIHEHIHILVPNREVEPGKWTSHPPEFWEMERRMSPEAVVVWYWILMNHCQTISSDRENERTPVAKGWKKARAELQRAFDTEDLSHISNWEQVRDHYYRYWQPRDKNGQYLFLFHYYCSDFTTDPVS